MFLCDKLDCFDGRLFFSYNNFWFGGGGFSGSFFDFGCGSISCGVFDAYINERRFDGLML